MSEKSKFINSVQDKKLKEYLLFVYNKSKKKRELDKEIFMMNNNIYSSRCNRVDRVYKQEREEWRKRNGK